MIVRTWSGSVPLAHEVAFQAHLLETGIADYRAQPGLMHVALWHRHHRGLAVFTLVSHWRDMESIRAYAGPDPTRAVLYPGDEKFGLVPDSFATHHKVIEQL